MKSLKIKKISLMIVAGTLAMMAMLTNSCVESQKVAAKTGVQLWAENCQRCHNTPSPNTFSHEQWITIGMHMQTRALLTDKEREKIVGFLSQ
jgi:hypothetical protein